MHACMQSEVYLSGPALHRERIFKEKQYDPRTKGTFHITSNALCLSLPFVPVVNESAEKTFAASLRYCGEVIPLRPPHSCCRIPDNNSVVVMTGSADGTVTYGNDSVTVMPPIRKKAILWFPTPNPTPKSNCRSQVLMRSLTHIIYMMVMKPFPHFRKRFLHRRRI